MQVEKGEVLLFIVSTKKESHNVLLKTVIYSPLTDHNALIYIKDFWNSWSSVLTVLATSIFISHKKSQKKEEKKHFGDVWRTILVFHLFNRMILRHEILMKKRHLCYFFFYILQLDTIIYISDIHLLYFNVL